MAESLGEALLTIRTNDGTFFSDVSRAKGASESLGTSMDKTKGSSAQLATEMTQTARSADKLGDEMVQTAGSVDKLDDAMVRQRARGRENVQSLGAQRAGMQQLSFQLNDVATMYSLGARPMQIFVSQSGQVIQALQLMTGASNGVLSVLGGPWGIAFTSAVVVLVPFVAKLFEAEEAAEALEVATDNLGDAQNVLRDIIDTTTGALDRQKKAAIETAQALALVGIGESESALAATRGALEEAADETQIVRAFGIPVLSRRGFVRRSTDSAQVIQGFLDGSLEGRDASRQLRALTESGELSGGEFRALQTLIGNFGRETQNLERNQALDRFINGEATDEDRDLLQIADLIDDPEKKSGGRARSRRSRRDTGPSAEEVQANVDRELIGITQGILQARLRMALNAEERAEIQKRMVEWDRRASLASIEADEDLSAAQKAELSAAVTRLADAENMAIEFAEQAEIERDIASLVQERYDANRGALDLELQLADTEADRKAIALRLLEAEEEFLRLRLIAITNSETASDVEVQRAQIALDALRATAGDRRAAVARANETTVERYLRELQQSPEQINEAVDLIQIRGLDELEDQLINVMRGVSSLGDLFTSVADQIISDLLRIAIQQTIIKPLATSLFGGGGGGGGGVGDLFAGFFATGGLIPNGQFGIVGEEGPEPVFATSSGIEVLPNSSLKQMTGADTGGGFSLSMPISIDATGADAAGLERTKREIEQLRRDLPGMIVTVVQDADERRILLGGF